MRPQVGVLPVVQHPQQAHLQSIFVLQGSSFLRLLCLVPREATAKLQWRWVTGWPWVWPTRWGS